MASIFKVARRSCPTVPSADARACPVSIRSTAITGSTSPTPLVWCGRSARSVDDPFSRPDHAALPQPGADARGVGGHAGVLRARHDGPALRRHRGETDWRIARLRGPGGTGHRPLSARGRAQGSGAHGTRVLLAARDAVGEGVQGHEGPHAEMAARISTGGRHLSFRLARGVGHDGH
jgi:hypothetical protein